MPGKRPNEPIGPTNVPGQSLDPKIPDDEIEESDEQRRARESEKDFDLARTRIPPG